MARRRILVAYDISEPKRLRRVFDVMKGFGYALQYSVFLCDLSEMERIALKECLGDVINFRDDRIVLVDLGDAAGRGMECFEFMGRRQPLPKPSGPQII